MNILAFDTCFDACSVAVGVGLPDAGAARFHDWRQMRTGHAEALMPMIADVMRRAGLGFQDLDRLAVTHGPGTFTGTRIGIAAARGLALATDAPVVSASSLLIIGIAAIRQIEGMRPGDALLVARKARDGQHYMQLIGHDGQALTQPQLSSASQASALYPERRIFVTGTGTADILAAGAECGRRVDCPLLDAADFATGPIAHEPDAVWLLDLVLTLDPAAGPPAPLYLRPPDAKPQASKALPRVAG